MASPELTQQKTDVVGEGIMREGESKVSRSSYNFEFAFKSTTFADSVLRLCVSSAHEEAHDDVSSLNHVSKKQETTHAEENSDVSDKDFSVSLKMRSFGRFSALLPLHGMSSLSLQDTQDESCGIRKETMDSEMQVREVPVTAAILAAKSSFFLKLFTSGMSESLNKGSVAVHIIASEESVFMELLHFIYTGRISVEFSECFDQTLQLLLLADRFGVEDCLLECVEELVGHLPIVTVKEALLFLAMPLSVLGNPALSQLLEESKASVVSHFGPLLEKPGRQEFLSLSMAGLQVLLQADSLEVEQEEVVFLAFMEWIQHNCKDPQTRSQAVNLLGPDIRFPWMSASFIKQNVFSVPEMRAEPMQSILLESLLFKAARNEDQSSSDWSQEQPLSFCQPRRSYTPPVKSIYFDIPYSVCKGWSPDEAFQASSQAFCAEGRWFTLNAKLDPQREGGGVGSRFGLFLRLDLRLTFPLGEGVSDVDCEYQFCVKSLTSEGEYQVVKSKSACTFREPYHGWGSRDLFRKPWQEVLENHEVYFPGGAMHLRADLWLAP